MSSFGHLKLFKRCKTNPAACGDYFHVNIYITEYKCTESCTKIWCKDFSWTCLLFICTLNTVLQNPIAWTMSLTSVARCSCSEPFCLNRFLVKGILALSVRIRPRDLDRHWNYIYIYTLPRVIILPLSVYSDAFSLSRPASVWFGTSIRCVLESSFRSIDLPLFTALLSFTASPPSFITRW